MGEITQIPGMTVRVFIDGMARPEHKGIHETDNDTTTCTQYIEAVSGAPFPIRIKFGAEFQCLYSDIVTIVRQPPTSIHPTNYNRYDSSSSSTFTRTIDRRRCFQ
ncbi:hypothetical protein EJ08DRAFT_485141 [Tothia fuscella]|uniref:DUF7918 domain-containing protein n=1 Tax=Tothia fuscella TaxID=1048955 RepID=A0A9P4NHU6_9PEZI|nr:hypothetical protein EJ08DRAFT_485141 [Tothia fuscella]